MRELGSSRGAVSCGQGVLIVVSVVVLLWVGRLLDRFGIRRVILIGIATMSVALVIFSQVHSLAQLCLAMALLGVGSALATGVPVQTLAVRRFPQGAGKILGVVFAGQSLGGVMIPLASTPLIKAFGWRGSSLVFGVTLLFLFLFVLLLQNPPCRDAARRAILS